MSKILIVEDNIDLNRGIAFILKKDAHDILTAFNIESARKLFNEVDLIILDLNMPDGDGISFCKEIRESSSIPVIMLTARDLETDEVEGFEVGADDYITKPFSLLVLRARVLSLLRRSKQNFKQNIIISHDIKIDTESMKVYKNDSELNLSLTEYKLLRYLLDNKNQIILKEQILNMIWDIEGNFVDENTIAVNIRRLRKKVEDNPSEPKYIKTIHGMGYMWYE